MTIELPRASVAEIVGRNVHAQLSKERWSASKAATALGWTQTYMSRRITGKVPFDVNDLNKLARLLKITVAAFFEGAERGVPTDYKAVVSFRGPARKRTMTRPPARNDARSPRVLSH